MEENKISLYKLKKVKKLWKSKGMNTSLRGIKRILFGIQEGEPSYLFVASLKEWESGFPGENKIYVKKEADGNYEGVRILKDRLCRIIVPKDKCKLDYLFLVKVKETIGPVLEGSHIYVEKELKKDYMGEWSSMCGSYTIKVPKDKCVKLDELG